MKVGVTGHRKLNDDAWHWVRTELTTLLQKTARPLIGLTSLAIGTDQLFAEVVLELEGAIDLIIPFPNYEQTFETERDLAHYRRLKTLSRQIETQPNAATREQAYLKAGQCIAQRSELLLAVWDGQPSRGLGGTADIVAYAAATSKPTIQLNPISYRIERLGESLNA